MLAFSWIIITENSLTLYATSKNYSLVNDEIEIFTLFFDRIMKSRTNHVTKIKIGFEHFTLKTPFSFTLNVLNKIVSTKKP